MASFRAFAIGGIHEKVFPLPGSHSCAEAFAHCGAHGKGGGSPCLKPLPPPIEANAPHSRSPAAFSRPSPSNVSIGTGSGRSMASSARRGASRISTTPWRPMRTRKRCLPPTAPSSTACQPTPPQKSPSITGASTVSISERPSSCGSRGTVLTVIAGSTIASLWIRPLAAITWYKISTSPSARPGKTWRKPGPFSIGWTRIWRKIWVSWTAGRGSWIPMSACASSTAFSARERNSITALTWGAPCAWDTTSGTISVRMECAFGQTTSRWAASSDEFCSCGTIPATSRTP